MQNPVRDRLSVVQLAARWNLNPESIRRYIRAGHLKAIRHGYGGKYLVSLNEIQRFERERMGL